MRNFDTYELCNVDPDDISDILVKVQKSFGFKFGDTELKNVETFGELCDVITNKIQGNDSNDCTTQQAFYKLRNAISDTLLIDKNSIAPNTDLQNLFPRKIRRQSIKDVDINLGFKTNVLRPKYSITGILIVILLASFIGLFIFWQAGLLGLALSIIGLSFATNFANELALQTVGQLAEKISRENYLKSRRLPATANKSEITKKVKELFMTDLGLKEHQLVGHASFM